MFAPVEDLLLSDDISIMNLESVLTDTAAPVVSEAHMAYTSWAAKFIESGIDIVNLANDHVYGCGVEGYDTTLDALNAASLPYVENRDIALLVGANDLLLGFYASNGGAGSNMRQCITTLQNAGADIIIVCLNWNDGTTDLYMSNEYHSARYAIDCGADIVLGHNGVGLHYFETYEDSIIIYGLGEYAGGYDVGDQAAVLQITFVEAEHGLKISETVCIPIAPGTDDTPPRALLPGTEEYDRIILTLNDAPNYPESTNGASETENKSEDISAAETDSAAVSEEVINEY